MTEQHRMRVRAVFAQAADLPLHERALLDAACRGEADLRAEVEGLLAHDVACGTEIHDDGFLKSPLVRTPEESLRGTSGACRRLASPDTGSQGSDHGTGAPWLNLGTGIGGTRNCTRVVRLCRPRPQRSYRPTKKPQYMLHFSLMTT
jgi:hypothetical protein